MNENLVVINFKKRVMTFENRDIWIISPLDHQEGKTYVKPIKYEDMGGWDNSYSISEDYINPTTNTAAGEMGWRSTVSTSAYSHDALENCKNQLHEVSIMKCTSHLVADMGRDRSH